MKLNVMNKKQVEKTYTLESYDILYGTILDLTEAIDLEELARQLDPNSRDNVAFIKIVTNLIYSSRDLINELLLDMFEGLTMEELRRVGTNDIVVCLIELIGQAFPLIRRATSSVEKK